MKTLIKLAVVLAVLVGLSAAAYPSVSRWMAKRNETHYRTEKAARGRVEFVVNSTGTIKPVQEVTIGSFVSGPILAKYVDFNDKVTKGQMLAKIDPRLYLASVARDEAILETQVADVTRVEAQRLKADRDQKRAQALRDRNEDFISQAEMDQFRFTLDGLEAQLTVAKAAVRQAEASLENSRANLGYTDIKSPVDGIVTDCKIEDGQTLAASFQTPELFKIAPNMDKKMHVIANVDEADIGYITKAQEREMPVTFKVDAYPDDKFEGDIYQIRKVPTTTQNVVTYPVVIEAPNPELKLLPGMTADISFHVEVREDVLRVPNMALLFFPSPQQVRPEDRKLVDGSLQGRNAGDGQQFDYDQRYVWVKDKEHLRAIKVRAGVSDTLYTEILEGDVQEGQELVTGLDLGPAKETTEK